MFYTALFFFFTLILAAGIAAAIWFAAKTAKAPLLAFVAIMAVGSVFYFSFLDNYLARRWGGTLVVKLPADAQMVAMTWKESSLWYQYYIPSTNECVFREDSPIGIVEGEVRTPNCNPVGVVR
ncbi:hypothetical protein P5704_023855 (plasmid) [Pseudomonas sp. FeN3W]|nr:hypothetical protein P5704_023855 [Pseudomonas sp. FeN3W]